MPILAWLLTFSPALAFFALQFSWSFLSDLRLGNKKSLLGCIFFFIVIFSFSLSDSLQTNNTTENSCVTDNQCPINERCSDTRCQCLPPFIKDGTTCRREYITLYNITHYLLFQTKKHREQHEPKHKQGRQDNERKWMTGWEMRRTRKQPIFQTAKRIPFKSESDRKSEFLTRLLLMFDLKPSKNLGK